MVSYIVVSTDLLNIIINICYKIHYVNVFICDYKCKCINYRLKKNESHLILCTKTILTLQPGTLCFTVTYVVNLPSVFMVVFKHLIPATMSIESDV